MRLFQTYRPILLLVATCLLCLLVGWRTGHNFLGSAMAAVLACLLGMQLSLITSRRPRGLDMARPAPAETPVPTAVAEAPPSELDDLGGGSESDKLVRAMMRQGRYALLLRPQVAVGLQPSQIAAARRALDDRTALVPAGEVRMHGWRGAASMAAETGQQVPGGRLVQVESLLLDRYPVTNRAFREFVHGGGYRQMSLWDPAVWPAVLEFVDSTGCPGPRYWRQGNFAAGLEEHPVVGICWYEALAYARWIGKRLPTDPEWVKAGSWPVPTSQQTLQQRKFPWGDTMDRHKANLWGTGDDRTCAVHDLPEGASVGGVYHLIGNVWEWTANNFNAWDGDQERLALKSPMKSLRGGAFDTYFENQASLHFQSGDSPLARKHNIGFRCAISLCDLAAEAIPDDAVGEHAWTDENRLVAGDAQ